MGSLICARCQGDREPDSSQYSYCKACVRLRAKEKYQANREAVGKTVRDYGTPLPDKRLSLVSAGGLPGRCTACTELVDKVVTVYTGDRDRDEFGGGEPFTLFCLNCQRLINTLSLEDVRRVAGIFRYLKARKTDWAALLPDLPSWNTDSKLLPVIKPQAPEQTKSP